MTTWILISLSVIGFQTQAGRPVTLTPIANLNAAEGVFATATQQVIRDQASWEALWTRLSANASPAPAVPHVDFKTDMLIVAAMGTKGHGGYRIAITAATEQTGGAMTVEVTESSPGAGCMTAMMMTSPVVIVRVPRHEGQVTFNVVQKKVDCKD